MQFPELAPPYDLALRACVAEVFRNYDVVAVVASGTIVRGTPDKRSDLDVHVLHGGTFRERLQVFHAGVPCEVFLNPPSRIRQYFADDALDRRPMSAHMFATGFVVFDPTGVAQELVAEAQLSLDRIPDAPNQTPLPGLYGAATLFEDADDLVSRDPDAAALLLCRAVWELVQCRVSSEPGWLPRDKDLLARLRHIDPGSARLAVRAASSAPFEERLEAARALCVKVAGTDGFFEWRSPREDV